VAEFENARPDIPLPGGLNKDIKSSLLILVPGFIGRISNFRRQKHTTD
jgi:hypothetical protein